MRVACAYVCIRILKKREWRRGRELLPVEILKQRRTYTYRRRPSNPAESNSWQIKAIYWFRYFSSDFRPLKATYFFGFFGSFRAMSRDFLVLTNVLLFWAVHDLTEYLRNSELSSQDTSDQNKHLMIYMCLVWIYIWHGYLDNDLLYNQKHNNLPKRLSYMSR